MKKEKKNQIRVLVLALAVLSLVYALSFVGAADPQGPTSLNITSNETKSASPSGIVNISGGYIATLNLTATQQNPRWKALVGQITGKFTLDDASGSTIFDWTLATTTGRVYATRYSSTIGWTSVNCSNTTHMEQENTNMQHTRADDNITATFDDNTHNSFWVGSVFIPSNTCPTLNTYVDNSTSSEFEEMVLYDPGTAASVFATILEENQKGFDSNNYDFQMIIPEVGLPSFTSSTAYYLYLEITG